MASKFQYGQRVWILPERAYSAAPQLQDLLSGTIWETLPNNQYRIEVPDAMPVQPGLVCYSTNKNGIYEEWQLRSIDGMAKADALNEVPYFDGLGNVYWRGGKMTESEWEKAR